MALRRALPVAACALALAGALPGSAATPPTKLWYRVSIVYVGSTTGKTILPRGGGTVTSEFKSGFRANTDTAVLFRSRPGGRAAILVGRLTGKLTRHESTANIPRFPGTHAPCTEISHEKLKGQGLIDGIFSAEPGSRRGQTVFGAQVSSIARTTIEWPELARCAGIPFGRTGELTNTDEVQRGKAPPLYRVFSKTTEDSVGTIRALAKPSEVEDHPILAPTAGTFGAAQFTLNAHTHVGFGPTVMSDNSIVQYTINESWTFKFTRCPGTKPC